MKIDKTKHLFTHIKLCICTHRTLHVWALMHLHTSQTQTQTHTHTHTHKLPNYKYTPTKKEQNICNTHTHTHIFTHFVGYPLVLPCCFVFPTRAILYSQLWWNKGQLLCLLSLNPTSKCVRTHTHTHTCPLTKINTGDFQLFLPALLNGF